MLLKMLAASLLTVLSVICTAYYVVIHQIGPVELKRRARRGDNAADQLYRAAAYGLQLRMLLAGLAGLSAYGALVVLEHMLGGFFTFIVASMLVTGAVLFMSANGGLNKTSLWLARLSSPFLAYVLEFAEPLFDLPARAIRRFRPFSRHTGLYEKADMLNLLERQKQQPDNRIPKHDLELLVHALEFADRHVDDILTPKRIVKTVASSDTIGPILMDELHATGFSRFPVYAGGDPHNLIGVLYLHDLIKAKHGESVAAVMRKRLIYVHEDYTLRQVLQAFLRTKQHIFIVVNEFEEYVGIVTVEDIIEQVIGHTIVDEFDKYEDLRTVAKSAAHKDHANHTEPQHIITHKP